MEKYLILALVCGTNITSVAHADWVAGRDMKLNELSITELINPNGQVPEWSYGFRDPVSKSVALFDSSQHINNTGAFEGYNPDVSSNNSVVIVNVSGSSQLLNGGTVAIDQIVLHPGSAGREAVVRWTAPASGRYLGQYNWNEIDPNGDGGNSEFLKNGVVEKSFEWNAGAGQGGGAIFDLNLAKGDVLDFALGMRGNFFSDTMGFDATISAVPLPATSWCLTPALLGFVALRRRKVGLRPSVYGPNQVNVFYTFPRPHSS